MAEQQPSSTISGEQTLPTPGKEDVAPFIIEDLRKRGPLGLQIIDDLQARTAAGIVTYGTPLQTHNGRNALRDLYEELVDALQYSKQVDLEGPHSFPYSSVYWEVMALVLDVRSQMFPLETDH